MFSSLHFKHLAFPYITGCCKKTKKKIEQKETKNEKAKKMAYRMLCRLKTITTITTKRT